MLGPKLLQILLCVCVCCVCVSAVCVSAVCVSAVCVGPKICVIPRTPAPPPDPPPPPNRPSAGPPSAGPPKISRFFFLLPLPIFILFFSLWGSSRVFFSLSGCLLVSFFLSLGVFSWNFGGVLVGRDLKCACSRLQVVVWKPPPTLPGPTFQAPPFLGLDSLRGPTLRAPPCGAPPFLGLGSHPSKPQIRVPRLAQLGLGQIAKSIGFFLV